MHVLTIETPSLGDRSYVVHDGEVAAVVDPQRDLDRVQRVLADEGVRVVAVFETHVHNDYVSGGLELCRLTGAAYHVAADDEVAFERVPARDGDVFEVGTLRMRARHTPGHTPTHLSWVAEDADGDVAAVFTGGSMLFGSVGRTDLVPGTDVDQTTRHQYRSVRGLAEDLADAVAVHPTHGFGSFCSSGDTVERDESTIGQEKQDNDALVIDDEDEFVRQLVEGLDAWPSYYRHMGPRNREGAAAVDLSPAPEQSLDELRARIDAGEWVVDLRNRGKFAAEHLAGTVNVEHGDSAVTYLGWVLPWGTPVTLLADDEDAIAAMQRDLVRIGIDRPVGRVVGLPSGAPTASYRTSDFEGLEQRPDDAVVLDVRRDGEWSDGHVDGAIHVPLHDLLERMDEVPADRQVWVHCASGFRASIAASLLDRAGRDVVLVDGDYPG